jgi:putative oxidoreductase
MRSPRDPVTFLSYKCEITTKQGENLQRLFTMFPSGWPGAGLLLLRLAAAIPLLIGATSELFGAPQNDLYARYFAIGVGSLLLAGFWTPVVGALQAIGEVWFGFSQKGGAGVHFLLAALGVSLVMLGPGAWSVDARLFGRKRIDIRTH